MATIYASVSDMLVTVKSREVQRGMFAEMRGDHTGAARHFLAAAHLELVLAEDYAHAGQAELAWRSQLSAVSCFWRAGQPARARELLATLRQKFSTQEPTILQVLAELERDYPTQRSDV